MKAFKYILFLLLIAIIGVSIYIAVQPNSFEVTRSHTIKAPTAVIYDNVIDFKNWEAWSSWKEENPEIEIKLPEQTKGINGSYSWVDDGEKGTMTTIATNAPNSIEQKMQIDDFPASKVVWKFEAKGDGTTKVTRTISGTDLPFMFKAFMTLSGGMEKQIGPHFEREFEKLDSIVVNGMNAYTIKVDGITEHGGGFYMYKTTSASSSNISNMMAKQYADILNFMQDHSLSMNGMPFTIYNEMNANGDVIMSNAIPVRDKVIVADDSNVLCGYMDKARVVKTTLKGNYTHLGKAWESAMKYIKDNHLEQSEAHPFEIYTNDPGNTPNPADWTTEIYIPIKEEVIVTETEQL
ncbi:MAG: SRPBCC family protein [Gelidibacter sp.]|nr:SRPBCC family protein [Gelidibacter sp.]